MKTERWARRKGIEDASRIIDDEIARHIAEAHKGEEYLCPLICERCRELSERDEQLQDDWERE